MPVAYLSAWIVDTSPMKVLLICISARKTVLRNWSFLQKVPSDQNRIHLCLDGRFLARGVFIRS